MYTDKLHLTSFSKESRCRRLYPVHNLQPCIETNVRESFIYPTRLYHIYTTPVPYLINNKI